MIKYLYSIAIVSFLCQTSQAQDWSSIADLPSGKHHPVTFANDGVGYSVTGWDVTDGPSRDFYKYDPAADEWSIMPQFLGAPRSYAIGYAYKGKGYVGFGATVTAYLGDIWEYDPATEDWDFLTTCPCQPRRHPAFLMANDKIFVGLGDGANGNLNDWWEYDMIADEWTQLPNLPGPQRHHPFQFAVNGELYAGMGHGTAAPNIYDDWYHFDQESSTWETMSDFPGEARVAGTQFSHGDFGYVLSGDGDNHSFMQEGEFWQYDPNVDDWNQFPSHPGISLWAPGSFVIGDTVYFLGGENRQSGIIQSDAWKFKLPTPEEPAGLAQSFNNTVINLFPNPAKDVLHIQSSEQIASVEIYTLSGQLVKRSTGSFASIMVSHLTDGVFLAKVQLNNGEVSMTKWVKH